MPASTFKIQDRQSFTTKAGNEMFLAPTSPIGFAFKQAKPANVANNRKRITSTRDSDPKLLKMFADSRRKLGNRAKFSVTT